MQWLVWVHVLSLPCIHGVLPTGILSFEAPASAVTRHQFCSPSSVAGWGLALPTRRDDAPWKPLMQLPAANRHGCASYKAPHDALVLVDRGKCSVLAQALQAQAARAHGLIVRGTKEDVYEAIRREHVPASKPVFEYDCSRGEAFVTSLARPVWDTDAPACHHDPRCWSRTCILTGQTTTASNETRPKHQVCCMWDTFVLLGVENRTLATDVTIPVVYITIAHGHALATALATDPTSVRARLYRRDVPLLDVSSVLLWALGVMTAVGAAYASVDRRKPTVSMDGAHTKERHGQETRDEREPIVWELDARHAVSFILLAGVALSVLYYVPSSGLIPVLYAVSGAATMAQVVTTPVVDTWLPSLAERELSLPLVGDTVRCADVVGLLPTSALALVWYVHRRTYWILQDVMGMCLCVAFLRTVAVPNLRVATLLLSLACVYDVFFVFVSPLVFGSSVMEDVATGGPAAYTKRGYPGVDYCERYPAYAPCIDPDPLPMLLVLPRVYNWIGGVCLLGLGDVIVPGLLLAFTLRYDDAQGGRTHYFRLMALGYASGLAMANVAVAVSNMGQPALLYLVPSTLGALLVLSKRNGDLDAMWTGAGVMNEEKASDASWGYQAISTDEDRGSGQGTDYV
ncbi:hypothetical protein PsorP6_014277 [Peronosclerospora sorghi]|uniref:Uncharacterized protein n=1 Tax=Peronosclerospora sorghi TaxID=230839 RepID=A0ACC0VI64_9STRA|nr:hypothetical protein PsorP6_014277 [Peronosclerospora sorghi]